MPRPSHLVALASLLSRPSSAFLHGVPTFVLPARPSSTLRPSGTAVAMASAQHGILAVLSPAKTLDLRPLSEREFERTDVDPSVVFQLSCEHDAGRCDAGKTNLITNTMKSKSEAELKKLLGISDKLAKVAAKFWGDYTHDAANVEYRPAIYTFSGPAYQGLEPSTCDNKTLRYMAANLFVLDPVYGVLRALQGMQPYRLEMGCKLLASGKDQSKKETLAFYWREAVTSHLGKQLVENAKDDREGRIVANLASEEYSAAIHPASLPPNTTFLNVVFRNKGRVVAVHAKRARGLMARFLAESEASTLEDVSAFDWEGYACVPSDEGGLYETVDVVGEKVTIARMMFDREEAPPKGTAGKRAGTTTGGASKKAKR